MSLIKSKQVIHINSSQRLSGSDSNFTVRVPLMKNNKFNRITVLSASIPKSFYLVPENKNTFIVEEDKAQETVTIPPGNYTVNSFIFVINNLFLQGANFLPKYSVSYPDNRYAPETGKLTWTRTGVHDSSFIFEDTHLAQMFGFDRGSTAIFDGTTLVSTNIIDFQIESTLLLHSNLASNSGQDDILLELFASGNRSLSRINFESQGNLQEHSKTLVGSGDNIFNFYLTNEYNDLIDLNNVNLVLTLCFWEIENINSLITGFIKYKTLTSK